jgi:transaldolase
MQRRAVFLDRDGVLNRAMVRDGKPYPPESLAEVEILPGVVEGLRRLKEAGFVLIVVSNQPDVARGTTPQRTVEAINAHLAKCLPIDRFIMCYHDSSDGCDCRKPRPGMLFAGVREFDVDLTTSFIVGDRWRDVAAGIAAGCKTIFIDYGYDEKIPQTCDYRVSSTREAIMAILQGAHMKRVEHLKVKIFADGADKTGMLDMYRNPLIQGFTTNPTLMRNAGVADYQEFARDILQAIPDRPISFEVFSDDFDEMQRQAEKITCWGQNVYVKIPVTNTRGQPSIDLVHDLARAGVKLNVTALLTLDQVRDVSAALAGGPPACVSVFAGRIADTGRDPVPLMAAAVEQLRMYPNVELIWASPRELLNIFQADAIGCHIITATNDILKKLALVGKDLHEYSLDTVKMFREDAVKARFSL